MFPKRNRLYCRKNNRGFFNNFFSKCFFCSFKGQVSMEYLTIVAFSLMIMIPIIVLSISYSDNYNYKFKSYQAQKALDTFTSISDELFFEGFPSKRTVKIFVPDNIVDFYVLNDKVLFFVLRQKDGFVRVYSSTKYANLSAVNFTGSGYLTFELYSLRNNTIAISKV